MKKEITITGPSGTYTGFVKVEQYSKSVTIHNRITHDETDSRIQVYRITGVVDNKVVVVKEDVYEIDAMKVITEIEDVVKNNVTRLASYKKPSSFEDRLKSYGYS